MPNIEAGHEQATTKRMRGDGSLYQRGSTWWICYYVDGQQRRESTKKQDEAAALKYLRSKLKEVHAHELDPSKPVLTQRDRRKTVGDLMDALEKNVEVRGISTPQSKSQFNRVREDFAGVRAASLTKEHVDQYISQRMDEATLRPQSTARRNF